MGLFPDVIGYGKFEKDVGFECLVCGSNILEVQVIHAILDESSAMSGSEKCKYEPVPYCPKCEQKPDYHGSPIIVK